VNAQSSTAQTPSTSQSTSSSTENQTANPPASTSTAGTQTSSDQNAAGGKNLPQTATPLPLLALLGLGSLGGGLLSRKKK
jgi:LPXTG-motif cell wall-anchored protein